MDDKRLQRLNKRFNDILRGRETVKSSSDARLFLESVYSQADPSVAIEKLGSSPQALKAIRLSFRTEFTSTFMIDCASPFLRYFGSDPSLKQLGNGQFFQQVLEAIVDPPSFFQAFTKAFNAGQLNEPSTEAFAWLLLECLCLFDHEENPEFLDVAKEINNEQGLIKSDSKTARTYGQKIKQRLDILSGNVPAGKEGEPMPGGRHDNDHADFRQISILPSADELSCAEEPFLRRVEYLTTSEADNRSQIHLDNQFRLNREDFLAELKNDLLIASQKRRGFRRSQVLSSVRLQGVSCGREKRRRPFALKLSFENGLPPEMRNMTPDQRKTFLKSQRNRNVLAHGAVACLTRDKEPVAFGAIERDVDLLCSDPPCIIVEFAGGAALHEALLALSVRGHVELIVVNTAFFACEPILQRLQESQEVIFPEELLFMEHQPIDPHEKLASLIETLNSDPQKYVQEVADGTGGNGLQLDASQVESIHDALHSRVSLIQGPPGKFS